MHVINFLCVLATPICVVAHHPPGRSPPFFLTPRKGHGARARPSGPRPRASWKGGGQKKGDFSHLDDSPPLLAVPIIE